MPNGNCQALGCLARLLRPPEEHKTQWDVDSPKALLYAWTQSSQKQEAFHGFYNLSESIENSTRCKAQTAGAIATVTEASRALAGAKHQLRYTYHRYLKARLVFTLVVRCVNRDGRSQRLRPRCGPPSSPSQTRHCHQSVVLADILCLAVVLCMPRLPEIVYLSSLSSNVRTC